MRIPEYDALRGGTAVIERPDRGVVRLDGADRKSFLQGVLTNDVLALEPGGGCYAAMLTPQGRMIADMNVFDAGGFVLLDVAREQAASIASRFDHSIFSEDVSVREATAEFGRFALAGPRAGEVTAAVAAAVAAGIPGVRSFANPAWPIPVFELFCDPGAEEPLRAAFRAAGAVEAGREEVEAVRIEEGVPLFGVDMDDDTIPLEAGIEGRAISFTKGCYVGQEVIVRVLHRGHGRVARKLVRLEIDVASDRNLPPVGTPLVAEGREVGKLTSVAWSPRLGKGVALGYVHRDFASPGARFDNMSISSASAGGSSS